MQIIQDRKKVVIATVVLFSFFLPIQVWAEWKELKGDHFIVFYEGSDSFAREVSRKSEQYYRQVSSDLGHARYTDFWQWDKRVKIYIYPTREDYVKKTGENEWSEGVANYDLKEIQSYAWKEGFLEALLPHEITHLIFRDYVGFKGEIPLWLDEGVAQWQEPAKRAIVKETMKALLKKGEALSMRDLTGTDVRGMSDKKVVTNFYIQAMSVVDFLVKGYGSAKFIAFCRELKDGKGLEKALSTAYPASLRNLEELEEKWKNYIMK